MRLLIKQIMENSEDCIFCIVCSASEMCLELILNLGNLVCASFRKCSNRVKPTLRVLIAVQDQIRVLLKTYSKNNYF